MAALIPRVYPRSGARQASRPAVLLVVKKSRFNPFAPPPMFKRLSPIEDCDVASHFQTASSRRAGHHYEPAKT